MVGFTFIKMETPRDETKLIIKISHKSKLRLMHQMNTLIVEKIHHKRYKNTDRIELNT